MHKPLRIEVADPGMAAHLIAASDLYMSTLYPAESNHFETIEALRQSNVRFLIGFCADQVAACGAVKIMDDDGRYGEIKRVFVAESQRGKGHASAIMNALEAHLREIDVPVARLETGISQAEALGLYRKLGYRERAPFGKYRPDRLSVFMEKQL